MGGRPLVFKFLLLSVRKATWWRTGDDHKYINHSSTSEATKSCPGVAGERHDLFRCLVKLFYSSPFLSDRPWSAQDGTGVSSNRIADGLRA